MNKFNPQIIEESGLAPTTSTTPSQGSFCGILTAAPVTYVTRSRSVTLYVTPDRATDHFNAYYDVLTQNHFLKRYNPLVKPTAKPQSHPSSGSRSCDVTLHNCASNCRISSPHYPSAYPRNITCRYRVTFDRPQWQVALGGRSTDRYHLGGDRNDLADCAYDRLVISERLAGHDGYQHIATFCGSGTFPQVHLHIAYS